MDARKRPRNSVFGAVESNQYVTNFPSVSVNVLQAEVRTLRTELEHCQNMRAIERKNACRSEARLKRQLADAFEEINQNQDLIESMREEIDLHDKKVEHSREEWLQRIQWYEEQFPKMEEGSSGEIKEDTEQSNSDNPNTIVLRNRLEAAMDQVRELSRLLKGAEERLAIFERRATATDCSAVDCSAAAKTAEVQCVEEQESDDTGRWRRIKNAELERAYREILRQNQELKNRLHDTTEYRERAASNQRRVDQLEAELQNLSRKYEQSEESHRQWMVFRNEIMQEELIKIDDEIVVEPTPPPEISSVLRVIQKLKLNLQQLEEEKSHVSERAEVYDRQCRVLEKQVDDHVQSISSLNKEMKQKNEKINELELGQRKVLAQQSIWQREAEGMRSLLDTYEKQSSTQSNSLCAKLSAKTDSPTIQGLQLSLASAHDEIKLLSEENKKIEDSLKTLHNEYQSAKIEHERVLEKFHKIRDALMDERLKAEDAENRACHAETLAGKGSYNFEITRVVHLRSNPLSEAVKEKHHIELEALKRRLCEMEEMIATTRKCDLPLSASTPMPSKLLGESFGSAAVSGKDDNLSSLDAQKLHKRLKERFKEQIGLFREGVYLITGFKIDMALSDSDCPRFKVRSIFCENEEDHLMFQWPRCPSSSGKGKDQPLSEPSSLDLMTTDMARLLMNGPSGIYMTKFESLPAFMASVTLGLFEKQTII